MILQSRGLEVLDQYHQVEIKVSAGLCSLLGAGGENLLHCLFCLRETTHTSLAHGPFLKASNTVSL